MFRPAHTDTLIDSVLFTHETIGTARLVQKRNFSDSYDGYDKASKSLIATPYSVSRNQRFDFVAKKRYTNTQYVAVRGDNLLWDARKRLPLPTFDYAAARNRALSNASRRAEALALVTIAESKKTVDMVKGLFLNLYRWFVSILKSVKTLDIPKLFDISSEIWLQFRYGWRPLYGEIQNVSAALKKSRKAGTFSSFGSDIVEPAERSFSTYHQYANGSIFNLDHVLVRRKVITKSGLTYQLSHDNNVMDRLGFHLNSILNTAWELIPFSFILDWFIGIGDYLSDLASETVKPDNSYDSVVYSYELTSRFRDGSSYDPVTPPTFTNFIEAYSRTIPEGQHAFELEYGWDLNWGQITDLSAIIYSILRSRFK